MSESSRPDLSLKTLLVAPNQELGGQIRQVLEQGIPVEIHSHLEEFPDSAKLATWLSYFQPELVLVDISGNPEEGEQNIRRIKNSYPRTHVVAMDSFAAPHLVIGMLRAGASDFWSMPFDRATVCATVGQIMRLARPQASLSSRPRGRVLAFTSTKPGAGASTIATQSAFALSRVTGQRVLLLDLNLENGGSAHWLEGPSHKISTEQLLHDPPLVADPRHWADVTSRLHGVDLVPAPGAASDGPFRAENLGDLLEAARRAYEFVLLDLPTVAHPMTLAALPLADEAHLVSTPDLTSLHLTQRSRSVLLEYGVSLQHVRCILNRTRTEEPLAVEYVEKSLQTGVEILLSNDYLSLQAAGTAGHPLAGDGRLAQGFRRLARQIFDRSQKPSTPRPQAEPNRALAASSAYSC